MKSVLVTFANCLFSIKSILDEMAERGARGGRRGGERGLNRGGGTGTFRGGRGGESGLNRGGETGNFRYNRGGGNENFRGGRGGGLEEQMGRMALSGPGRGAASNRGARRKMTDTEQKQKVGGCI